MEKFKRSPENIGEGEGAVVNNLKKFSEFDQKKTEDLVYKTIGLGEAWRVVKEYLRNFPELDHQEIVDKIIADGKGWTLECFLKKFSGLDKEIAEKLIKAGYGRAVANNLGSFSGLDKKIVLKLLNDIDQEAQIITAKYFIKRDLRKEKELKPAEGILVLEILKALGMDFYVLLSECWAGKTTAENIRKQYFDFEIENIDQDRQQELNNQLHALVMAAGKIMKEKEREKFDELKGKYDVNTEKQKIINEWSNHHRELEDQAGNLLRNIVNEGLRKAYIEWREDEVSEWFCKRDKIT